MTSVQRVSHNFTISFDLQFCMVEMIRADASDMWDCDMWIVIIPISKCNYDLCTNSITEFNRFNCFVIRTCMVKIMCCWNFPITNTRGMWFCKLMHWNTIMPSIIMSINIKFESNLVVAINGCDTHHFNPYAAAG